MSGFGNPFGQSGSGFGQSNPFGQAGQQTGSASTKPSTFGQTQSSPFGQVQTPSVFGQTTQGFSQGQTTQGFGQGQTTQGFGQGQTTAIFGQTRTNPSGTAQSSGFGSQTTSSAFGQTQPSPFASNSSTTFGQTTTTTGGFGTSTVFGSSTTSSGFTSSPQTNLFATAGTKTVETFGSKNVFGASTASVFGSKDSKASFGAPQTTSVFGKPTSDNAFAGSAFGKPTVSQSSSVFGGSSSKTVFGSHPVSTTGVSGFGISTSAGKTSSVFGSKASGSTTTQSVFGSTSSSSVIGGNSNTNVFGGAKKETESSNVFGTKDATPKSLFGTVKTESKTNVFGGTNEQKSNIFGGAKNTQSAFPQSSSSTNLFASSSSSNVFGGGKPSEKSSQNLFQSAASSSSSSSIFKKSSNLPSTDLVQEESPAVSSDSQQSKSATSVFGGSNVFGSGSGTQTDFSFTSKGADNETGESKPVSLFGGARAGGGKLFGAAECESEADRGRKRTIKREEDQDSSSKRGRSLFSSAMAGVSGRSTRMSDRLGTQPTTSRSGTQPMTSRSGDQDSQSGEDLRKGGFQKLKRLSSMTEDVASKIAIVCKGVPAKFNKGAILRKHFSKYGSVAKVFPNINKNTATIHFHDHKSAAEAKSRGRMLGKGLPSLQIFWSSHSPMTSRTASRTSSTSETTEQRETKEARKRSQWDEDDVGSELTSMAGTEDVKRTLVKKEPQTRAASPSPPRRHRPAASYSPSRASPTPSSSAASTASTATVPSTTDIVSLSSLRTAVARNVHDMAKILDQRDKFIREGRTKQSDLATARAFVGTCMDMCPEKERYDREDKRRCSPYEIVPGTENIPGQNPKGDPYRMVKEYSRSSADQDEPLAHELRPTPVLIRTMHYLLADIADKGTEGKWMDWYGFLWDRTRGIRKEITQQQLVSRDAVELLEKCARFHIYCGERLCEEDPHVFDQKINNENLTKCLQTLKEMYHDLDLKHDIFCPHESEFRAYIVLMNLNEGDTLREVQTLRQEVQNSPKIKFATKVYSALSSNNYVRFFRLVKQASFLNSCIIHRYFTQVRTLALQTMMKAYGAKRSQMPVSELVRILSFGDENEAASFCQFYGQSVIDFVVTLDRASFVVPECAYPQNRAIELIESKRTVAVGEVMNGAPLPLLQITEPQCSFDENGRFKTTQDLLQYAGGKDRKPQEAPASPEKRTPAPSISAVSTSSAVSLFESPPSASLPAAAAHPGQPGVSNEIVKMIAKELFWSVIDEFVAEISQSYVRAVQVYLDAGKNTVEEIVVLGTASLIRQLCTEVVDEERSRAEKAVEAEQHERRARVAETICHEIVEETTKQESLNLATAQIREVNSQLKKECEDRSAAVVSDKLVEESLSDFIQEISMEVYRVDVIQRREKLAAIEKSVKLYRTSRFFQTWKKAYAKQVKLKRAMLAFPCAPSSQKMDNQLKNLLPDRTENRLLDRRMFVNRQALVSIESPMEIEKRDVYLSARYSLLALYRRLLTEKAWRALDMPSVIGHEMNRIYAKQRDNECTLPDSVREITWKLVLSLPEASSSCHVGKHINKWMEAKLQRGKLPNHPDMRYKGQVLSLYHSKVEEKGRQPLMLGVCIRSVIGTLDKMEVQKVEEKRLLLGTCAILFVLPPGKQTQNYWKEATARLAGILHAKPVYPALPLVIVMPSTTVQPIREEVIESLEVDSFLDDGLVCDVQIMELSVDGGIAGMDADLPQASDTLCEKVEWLASQMPEPPELQRSRIKDYVEDFLQLEFFSPVLQNLRRKKRQHTLHQPPNTLITLYNCAVDHLAEVASSASLTTHSCPIAEFVWNHPNEDLPPAHWNLMDHLSYLYEEISLLQLPRFKYADYGSDTWEQVCEDVWMYINTVVKQNKGKDSVQLVTRIKRILQKVLFDFNDVCYLAEGEDRCEPTYVNMPWTDVIDACVNYRLSCLSTLDDNSQETLQRELYVYFEEGELEDFAPPPNWTEALLNTDAEVGPTILETVEKAVERKHLQETIQEEEEEEDIEEVIEKPSLISMTEGSFHGNVNNSMGTVCNSLISRIRAEKKEADNFEKYLENVLMEGSDFCVPNGNLADPYMEYDQDFEEAGYQVNGKTDVEVPDEQNGEQNGEHMDETELVDQTIGGKVNTFQENLFALRQDSHLFEERLKFLMNT